jgi:hypothetical protein
MVRRPVGLLEAIGAILLDPQQKVCKPAPSSLRIQSNRSRTATVIAAIIDAPVSLAGFRQRAAP